MRKNLTKKLFLSILTLAFAVISLGASTYAWFVLSEDATIDAFSGTVAAGTSGLEIQVTAKGQAPATNSWSATSISTELIQGLITDQVKFSALEKGDLTSADVTQLFKSQSEALGGEAKTVTANKDYIVFDVHFRLADADTTASGTTPLYISNLVFGSEESTDPTWNAAKAYKEDSALVSGGNIPQGPIANAYQVQDAARVAFINGTTEKFKYEATSGSEHYTAGHNNGLGAIDYYNKVNEVSEGAAGYITVPDGYYTPDQLVADELNELALIPNNGQHVTLTVYVWIEGWDNECINDIFNQKLNVSMTFTIDDGSNA